MTRAIILASIAFLAGIGGRASAATGPATHCEIPWQGEFVNFRDQNGAVVKKIKARYETRHEEARPHEVRFVSWSNVFPIGCDPDLVVVSQKGSGDYDYELLPINEQVDDARLDYFLPNGELRWSKTFRAGINPLVSMSNGNLAFVEISSPTSESVLAYNLVLANKDGIKKRLPFTFANDSSARLVVNGQYAMVNEISCPCIFFDLKSGGTFTYPGKIGTGHITDSGLATVTHWSKGYELARYQFR